MAAKLALVVRSSDDLSVLLIPEQTVFAMLALGFGKSILQCQFDDHRQPTTVENAGLYLL